MTNGTNQPRSVSVAVLEAVKVPLTFFTLVLLVTEAALGAIALRRDSNGPLVLLIVAGVFLVVTAVVAFLAVRAPGALMGIDWLRGSLADSLADDVVSGFEGSVGNLESKDDKVTAWGDLIAFSRRERSDETVEVKKFRASFARGVQDRVFTKARTLRKAIEDELNAPSTTLSNPPPSQQHRLD